jgi:hypothetical protein
MRNHKKYARGMNILRNFPPFLLIFSLVVPFSVAKVSAQSAGSQNSSLVGTIQSGDFIGAVLSDAKGEQVFYRLKEKLPDGSQIIKVRADSISLKGADGTSYDMYISHDTKTVASGRRNMPADPYASGSIQKTSERKHQSWYERRHSLRKGKNANDN